MNAVPGGAGTSPAGGPEDARLDDVTLVVRAREGDVHAYEELVRRYQGPMFRLAVRMLASRGDAEDVVQEVFLTAWRSLVSLHEEAAFVGWLYRMVTNRCLNVIRDRRAPHCLMPSRGFSHARCFRRRQQVRPRRRSPRAIAKAWITVPAHRQALRQSRIIAPHPERVPDQVNDAEEETRVGVSGHQAPGHGPAADARV